MPAKKKMARLAAAGCAPLIAASLWVSSSQPSAGADSVPTCPAGVVEDYVSVGNAVTFEAAAGPAVGAVPSTTAVDAVDAWWFGGIDTLRHSPKHVGKYCVAFGLLTNNNYRGSNGDGPPVIAKRPVWAVYVDGLHLEPTMGARTPGEVHTVQVFWVDALSSARGADLVLGSIT